MLALAAFILAGQQNPTGLALPGTAKVKDVVTLSIPSQVHLAGLLGDRYTASERHRLPYVDEDEMLSGFRRRPGKQAWIGEHAGKWLHAASLTYEAHLDPQLRAKMDRVAHGLMQTQEADGYMGTYPPGKRFSMADDSDWDVWVSKYCMIGLLSYYQATHEAAALQSARRIADLLIRTFGPGGQLFSRAGEHQGMAATSVLEPTVLLYRATGDARYLQFARRIVEAFNEPGGSHIERDLLTTHSVAKTANGKAYEMLSNLVGLAELYRATGEQRYLKPVQIAWNDIVQKRLYITGTGSSMEHWTGDGQMPNGEGADVGETCVTVTWIQLNLELQRLTGESKYLDQIERSVYNHLFAAQRADGAAWCYYTPLDGVRHPGSETTCCLSSGPRGIALMPAFAYASRTDGVDVNLYGASSYNGSLGLRQTSRYPFTPDVDVFVTKGSSTAETLRFRIPAWAQGATVKVSGRSTKSVQPGEYLPVRRVWRAGDRVRLHFPMPVEIVKGSGSNQGYCAVMAGPLVFAADNSLMSGNSTKLRFGIGRGVPKRTGESRIVVDGLIARQGGVLASQKLPLEPFFQAGANNSRYTVWLPTKSALKSPKSLVFGADESSSRIGNVQGSFADGDPFTYSVTFTGKSADRDWYAVDLASPIVAGRIVFRHGETFHDGGWFDTSSGKPEVQVKRAKGGTWETIGALSSYPQTDGSHDPGFNRGQAFEFRCAPTKVYGVRIVGRPSHGDNPAQAFSSCAEIEAYRN